MDSFSLLFTEKVLFSEILLGLQLALFVRYHNTCHNTSMNRRKDEKNRSFLLFSVIFKTQAMRFWNPFF